MATLKELQKLLDKAAQEIPEQTMKIVEVVGLNFIKKNFQVWKRKHRQSDSHRA